MGQFQHFVAHNIGFKVGTPFFKEMISKKLKDVQNLKSSLESLGQVKPTQAQRILEKTNAILYTTAFLNLAYYIELCHYCSFRS